MKITKKDILEEVYKTLTEQAAPMSFIKRFIAKYADDIAQASRRGESITGAIKRARGITRTEKQLIDAIDSVVEHTRIHSKGGRQALPKDTDELLKAIAGQGVKLSDDQWRQLYSGFFKAENVPMGFLDDLADDLVKNPKFISRYGNIKTEKGLINNLKNKGYSDNSINAIINSINEPENIGKFYGKAAASSIDDAGRKAKPKPKPDDVVPPKDTKVKPKRNTLDRYLRAKKGIIIAGAVIKSVIVLGVAALAYWLYKRYKGTITKDEANAIAERLIKFLEVRPCMADILDDDGVTLEIDPKGYTVIKVPNTGVPEYDQLGGLGFYDFGVVYKINQPKATGTYNCKGKELAEEYFNNIIKRTLFEQEVEKPEFKGDDNPNTGISGISIKWQTNAEGRALETASGKPEGNNCNNKPLPHEKGCRSAEVAEVQACLKGIRITFYLDDPTVKKLEELGYDMSGGLTKEIYDTIMIKCGKQPSTRTNKKPEQAQRPKQAQRPAINMPKMQSKQANLNNNKP